LDDGAWEFWRAFMYFQMKRAPAYLRNLADKTGHREALARAVEEAKRSGKYLEEDLRQMDDPDVLDRVYKNSLVVAQGLRPSDEVVQALAGRGMAVFTAASGRNLVIGEVPN